MRNLLWISPFSGSNPYFSMKGLLCMCIPSLPPASTMCPYIVTSFVPPILWAMVRIPIAVTGLTSRSTDCVPSIMERIVDFSPTSSLGGLGTTHTSSCISSCVSGSPLLLKARSPKSLFMDLVCILFEAGLLAAAVPPDNGAVSLGFAPSLGGA